jgi:hypothetical protein
MNSLKQRKSVASSVGAAEQGRSGPASKETDRDVEAATMRRMISEAAYFRAECRAFEGGREFEDRLAAETEIDSTWLDDNGRDG